MKYVQMTVMTVAIFALVAPATRNLAEAETPKPRDRVIAMYFHRTQRCPTCLKMGSYTEEAINTAFAGQLKEGTVEFHYVDFQDRKNAVLARAYKITGPALVVANVQDGKAKEYKNLKEIWAKVREKPEFVRYVRSNIRAYLE